MDPWILRSRRFWDERQRQSANALLTGYLLDESPPSVGLRRFKGEWSQVEAWMAARRGPMDAALDVGCGTGIWLKALSRRFGRVEGWDLAPSMIRASRRTLKEAGIRNATLSCGQIHS